MLNRIIEISLKNRAIVVFLACGLGAWGWWAAGATPIDAIPDLSDNQVIVFTDWPGHSAQEVEDQVSYPLTSNLQGLAGVRVVRSQSAFGFSMIYVIFEDAVDQYFARARVLERLSLVTTLLPEGITPTLGPDATGVGHVFWYTIESRRHSLRELRSLQDWFVRYQLNAVPGVAEVASIGGHIRQYQVDVDPNRLRAYNLTLGDVVEAVRNSNQNVGGNVLESGGTWSIVRGVGLLESVDDIAQIVVGAPGGVPVYVSQIGEVKIGDAFRVSSLVKGDAEAVGGVIVARSVANAQQVIEGVKARIEQISSGLPEGARIVPFYDRSELIEQAVDTLRTTLIEEVALVTLAHVVFLMHLRSILVVTLPLPLAVLMSFLAMYYAGMSSNIMSLAGIAIAIGVLVDAGIVVTENAFRQIERSGIDVRDRRAVWVAVLESTRLVGRPVFFSMVIIVLAFIPVFALTGQAGKLFTPLAFTKTFAVLSATVLAVTLVPVLCSLLLGGKLHDEGANPVMRLLRRLYQPFLEAALAHRWATLAVATLLLAGAVLVGSRIGSEFMPPLNEGDLLFMPLADPSISLEQNTEIARRQNAALMQVPEVEYAVAKVGRADTSTDPSPPNMTETVVHLKPRDQWRAGLTLEQLRAEMGAAAELPGVANIWTMPIINRIDMLSTGVRSEVGVKVYGSDLAMLDETARRVATVLRTVRGAASVYPEPLVGAQYLNVRIDRGAAARHGLSVAAVQDVIDTAVGERVVTRTLEGRQRFPVRVRYAAEYRDTVRTLGDVLVATPAGEQVPLAQVASFEQTRGAAMITSENGLLLATVLLNVQGRDVGGFVDEAKAAVAAQVTLPPGYFVGWSGRYENQKLARRRLTIIIPIVLLVIFGLLYFTYHSALEAAHVLLTVPFALTGGVYLLWMLGYNYSVAVWVGFIALFGTAVQTAVVMVIYLDEAVRRKTMEMGGALSRQDLHDAVMEGALLRLRPKVMTVSTVVAGLLPIMWSNRVGAEVMKPLATPVLGGMVSSLLYVLIVTPVLFYWIHEWRLRGSLREAPAGPLRGTRPTYETETYVGRVQLSEDTGGPGVSVPLGEAPAGRTSVRLTPDTTYGGDNTAYVVSGFSRTLMAGLLIVITLAGAGWWAWNRQAGPSTDAGTVLETVRTGDLVITLSNASGQLRQGSNRFRIEFRSAATTDLIDVGTVQLGGSMTMPGMVMTSAVTIAPAGQGGAFDATGDFGMVGSWRMTIEWNGPAGRGSADFEGDVQ
ncbi:MAG: CusA/CzcA family heavy metal efflux RND transporter [Acidobacteria bacterium]|nr:CusA/CzcA family heavy metal efflux RND transporter [Acidobacteriota bacterium]